MAILFKFLLSIIFREILEINFFFEKFPTLMAESLNDCFTVIIYNATFENPRPKISKIKNN